MCPKNDGETYPCPVDDCDREFDSTRARGPHFAARHSDKEKEKSLLDELQRLAVEFDRVPSAKIMNSDGKFSPPSYTKQFGSWNDALEKAGFKINKRNDISKEELLDELQNVANELGRTPKASEIGTRGKFASTIYLRKFGSWNDALEEAGLEINKRGDIPKDELLDDLRRLAEKLGRALTKSDVDSNGKFGSATYEKKFGSWNNALKEAGLEVNRRCDIPKGELLDELQRLADELDCSPRIYEMNTSGTYSSSTYYRRFGSWTDALKEAGLEPNKRFNISKCELLDELNRLADKIDSSPTRDEMESDGKYSTGTYYIKFGSWNNALKEAGLEVNVPSAGNGKNRINYGQNWQQVRKNTFEKFGKTCVSCGDKHKLEDRENHIHHITPARDFHSPEESDEFPDYEAMNDLSNLVPLCGSCHNLLEGKWQDCTAEEFARKASNWSRPSAQSTPVADD